MDTIHKTHTFRFVDDVLNQKLIALLKKEAPGKFSIDKKGAVKYSHAEEDLIGNELICKIRTTVFESWQIISFPAHWKNSYKRYMSENKVPFCEEIRDANVRFLIPRQFRPHAWKLVEPSNE
jgi:hypothetical protein